MGPHSGASIGPLTERQLANFWSKVDQSGDCWLWTGFKNPAGYGVVSLSGKLRTAHRVAVAIRDGVMPEGLVVRHSCDNPICVRPDHLILGTQGDNMRDRAKRGRTAAGEGHHNALKTHCPKGHEYTPENTYVDPVRLWRTCRTCQAAWNREYDAKRASKKVSSVSAGQG